MTGMSWLRYAHSLEIPIMPGGRGRSRPEISSARLLHCFTG